MPNLDLDFPEKRNIVFTDPDFKLRKFLRRHFPHKTKSGSRWCIPIWLVWFTGGRYDSGNGYRWRPNIFKMIKRYYREKWHNVCTLKEWLFELF